MNQLTTTNNINYFDKKSRYVTHQFKFEESLMERIFESCGYKFTIITLRNSEPYFIAKEVSEASVTSYVATISQDTEESAIIMFSK